MTPTWARSPILAVIASSALLSRNRTWGFCPLCAHEHTSDEAAEAEESGVNLSAADALYDRMAAGWSLLRSRVSADIMLVPIKTILEKGADQNRAFRAGTKHSRDESDSAAARVNCPNDPSPAPKKVK